MSVTPEKTTTKISRVAFAFVYSNNANSMTAYNAMLNIASAYASDNNDDNNERQLRLKQSVARVSTYNELQIKSWKRPPKSLCKSE